MKNRMKATNVSLVLSLLMLVIGYTPVEAQDLPEQPDSMAMPMKDGMMPCPMMHDGMMQGHMQGGLMGMMMQSMMSDPVEQSIMQVYMLPALDDALKLTDSQMARLEEAKQQFTRERTDIQEDLRAKEQQLREALNADQPDLEQVQALLADRAALEAKLQMAAVETAMQMQAVLSEEQREELAALKPMQMHRAMMTGLSMMEMMRMMQAMGGGCPMMDGMTGMMRGVMMRDGQMPMGGQMQPEDMDD